MPAPSAPIPVFLQRGRGKPAVWAVQKRSSIRALALAWHRGLAPRLFCRRRACLPAQPKVCPCLAALAPLHFPCPACGLRPALWPCWRWAARQRRHSNPAPRALTASRCTRAAPRWSARWPWPLAHARRCSPACRPRWTRKACRRRATGCTWASCGWTPASAHWCPNAPARRMAASAAWKTHWPVSTRRSARCSCRTATSKPWPPWRRPTAKPWPRPHRRRSRPLPKPFGARWKTARCAPTSCSAKGRRWSSACAHCSRSKAAAPARKAG